MRNIAIFAFIAGVSAAASRPNGTPVCDYYTTALLKDNNATNQETLVTLLVNTAVIGNYTKPNAGVVVPGILAQNATYNGTSVNLLPYFNGALASTNRGGNSGVSVNFLDGGGAAPLTMNKPSNGTSSNQYKLLTHLYEYFGILLGCTQYGKPGYSTYSGQTGMYDVHKFMALDAHEVQYFIQQVGLSALSFGVAVKDVEEVGLALQDLFGFRCAPEVDVVPGTAKHLQSICITSDCPMSPNATCPAYSTVQQPLHANGSVTFNGTGSPSSSSSASPTGQHSSDAGITRKLCGTLLVVLALASVAWLV